MNPKKEIIPTPVEFRRKVEAGSDFTFQDLIESLKFSTPDGRSASLHGFEQVHIDFYSLGGDSEIDQMVVIPESEEPIIQRHLGRILSFSYPYILRGDSSEIGGFRIISGGGVIQFMGVGLVSPTSDLIL